MLHHKFDEILKLVKASIAVLCTGEAGSGKTTLCRQVCDDLQLKFYSISMTRQTTLSHLLGYKSVSGEYISSSLRECFEHGGLMLLDEIDAGDPNVMLTLNTIENGYIAFPDALVNCHPDFRLMATSNPQGEHNHYTGRTKLDRATLDRFDIVDIDRDDSLERTLIDDDTHTRVQIMRHVMKENNSSKSVSMRDAIRYQKRKDLDLLNDSFVYNLLDKSELMRDTYDMKIATMPKHKNQSECKSIDDLVDLLKTRAGQPQPKSPDGDNDASDS